MKKPSFRSFRSNQNCHFGAGPENRLFTRHYIFFYSRHMLKTLRDTFISGKEIEFSFYAWNLKINKTLKSSSKKIRVRNCQPWSKFIRISVQKCLRH